MLLEVDDVHVEYGSVAALQGVSLHVERGETVGILGPNGAGKSTTLLSIIGSVRPKRGRITFDGRSIVGRLPESIARDGIALVPENRHIFTNLTIEENMLVGAATRTDKRSVTQDIRRIVERFPYLAKNFTSSAGGLSGGEQQQLAIARALVARPCLLLLDEPSLGLAPVIVDDVFDLIAELRSEGTTIVIVEQTVQRTLDVADRVYVLRRGSVEMEGPAAEVGATPAFEANYLGLGIPPVTGEAATP